jgi:hypothetical protein
MQLVSLQQDKHESSLPFGKAGGYTVRIANTNWEKLG